MVAEEAERFHDWQASLDVVRTIASLWAHAEEIRGRTPDGRVGDHTQILNKLLHLPTVRMERASATAEGAAYAGVVRYLFGLEEER